MFVSLVLSLLIAWAVPAWAANDHDLPTADEERRAWWADYQVDHITSGCLPSTPASSLTIAAFACTGYATDGVVSYYSDQAARTVTVFPDGSAGG